MIYSLSFLMPILSLFALFSEDSLVIMFPVFCTFILTPALDLLPLNIESGKASKNVFNFILYTACSLYLILFSLFLYKLPTMTGTEMLMKCSVMGINGVLFGINGAHELGHRNNKWDILFSKVLLFTTSYMHFYIEHNRGHHRNIATPADPATARYNETLYTFLVRSMVMSWISAFNLEKKKNGILHNRTLHYALFQVTFITMLGFIHINLLIGFVLHSLISIILLESVNYIEHYGIQRKMVNGRYEKVAPHHSWNSDHFF